MQNPLDYPVPVFVVLLAVFWVSARIGARFRKKRSPTVEKDSQDDFTFALGSTLTLLALVIGFTFSMAVGRYDQRKNYEEQEANAIGTEYVRADLLPVADAAKVRALLRSYLEARILQYEARSQQELRQINDRTARLQADLWSAVAAPGIAQPTPVAAIVLSGMNDVLNSQGYTQAAWWNRIPTEAWLLLITISTFCNLLLGYTLHGRSWFVLLVLPIVLSVSLVLIADIDSPRGGAIRVKPQNLEALAESLGSP